MKPLRKNCWFLLRHTCCILASYVLISFSAARVSQAAGEQDVAGPFYPKAGTYKLYKIQPASSGWVLEDNVWIPHRLSSYMKDKITLFSFFYGACRDPQGCPAAWAAFQAVHDQVKKHPELHNKVRLVFLSLDPNIDTPETMSLFKSSFNTPEAPWHFLTTWKESFLAPILNGMYVPAQREFDDQGQETDVITHLLKVFLIDKEGWVREIYTTSFLNPDVIMEDIGTLLLEEE